MANFTINIGENNETLLNTVGESVVKGDLLYLENDSKYYKATAANKSKSTTELKMALEDGDVNDSIEMLIYGYIKLDNIILTPNDKYYVSVNNGKIINQRYENTSYVIRYVGTAFNNSLLLFNPDQTYISDNGRKINDVAINSILPEHTHTEDEISDLDKYTKAEVNNLINQNKDKNYVHDQAVVANNWICNHNLNKQPSVTVIDTAGSEVTGEVIHNSLNQTIIKFNYPFSGQAFFN